MKTTKYPRGWDEARVRRVIEHYESQTDEDAAAEIESGLTRITMEVPAPLVPIVREIDYPSQGCKLPVYRSDSNIAVTTLDIASDQSFVDFVESC